jgi:hypothetical protein
MFWRDRILHRGARAQDERRMAGCWIGTDSFFGIVYQKLFKLKKSAFFLSIWILFDKSTIPH